ncbi:MAG: aldo/keto reductase [Deltaproteobacteria bacterium]|nr:aldo/keto reductase [Deltaproteobacteria bacterium]
MRYRKLGATGLEVSEIGFGAWGIGGVSRGATSYGATDDRESCAALEIAFDRGVTFFDTSDLYGYGHSEHLIGQVFKSRRDRVVLATKAGFVEHGGPQDFSHEYLTRSLEGSLRRLQTDYVDLFQLHSPPIDLLARDPSVLETLTWLVAQGKARAIGISVRSPSDGLVVVRSLGFKSIQVNFSMVDQRAIECGLLEACEELQVGIIARTPLCFGFLAGHYNKDTAFSRDDHRSTYSPKQRELWANATRVLLADVAGDAQSHAQVALRFCLSYPCVASAIPGMLKRAEVLENVEASELGPLPLGERVQVEETYSRHAFFLGKN